MATLAKDYDGAVVATFDASGSDTEIIRMGTLHGGRMYAQFTAAAADVVEGSNDGTNWGTVATTTGANSIIRIDAVPLYIRSPAANTGTVVVVGWRV